MCRTGAKNNLLLFLSVSKGGVTHTQRQHEAKNRPTDGPKESCKGWPCAAVKNSSEKSQHKSAHQFVFDLRLDHAHVDGFGDHVVVIRVDLARGQLQED